MTLHRQAADLRGKAIKIRRGGPLLAPFAFYQKAGDCHLPVLSR